MKGTSYQESDVDICTALNEAAKFNFSFLLDGALFFLSPSTGFQTEAVCQEAAKKSVFSHALCTKEL